MRYSYATHYVVVLMPLPWNAAACEQSWHSFTIEDLGFCNQVSQCHNELQRGVTCSLSTAAPTPWTRDGVARDQGSARQHLMQL